MSSLETELALLRSQLYDAQEQAKRDSATIERLRARNAELVAALKKDRP